MAADMAAVMDRRSGPSRGPVSPALMTVLLLAGLAAPLTAQSGTQAERGWLGIRLGGQLTCQWEAEGERKPCERLLTVSQILVGGPSDEAGLLPGDLLVAINGQTLQIEPAAQDRLLSTIRAGTPVSIDVARGNERHFVRVIPGSRPSERTVETGTWRGDVKLQVRPDVYVVAPTPLDGHSDSAIAVAIRTDQGGVVQVSPSQISIEDGRVYIRELEGDVVEFTRMLTEAFPQITLEVSEALKEMQDSVFVRARVKLDSLRFLAQEHAISEQAVRRSLERYRDVVSARTYYGPRLAGAEFRPLTGELADAFEGTDSGLLVLRVLPGTPAAHLGLKAGDVVTHAGEQECQEIDDLRTVLWRRQEAGSVVVRWVRKGREMTGVIKTGP